MSKRKREIDELTLREPPSKRTRAIGTNRFLDLSDELILRILSFLSEQELTGAERVCPRFQRLAADNELWREKFYLRFVRPRARRIPAVNALSQHERDNHALYYASKSARWLEHNTTPKGSGNTAVTSDWKRRYKVKLNWTKGRCRAREMALDCPYQPRTIVKICQGIIYTADEKKLRSYSQRARPQILNTYYWTDGKSPTSMAVEQHNSTTYVTVGLSDGSLEVLEAGPNGSFESIISYRFQSSAAVTSLATAWPYILTLSADREVTLLENTSLNPASLNILASLRSDAVLLPASLSIRRTSAALIASIVYSFNRLNAGWCLGLQEIRLGLSGNVLGSRLASTVETPMLDLPLRKHKISSRSTSTGPFALHPMIMNPPTSLSHSGCYILAGLPDNTLMVYTIVSNNEKLEINAARRLFGHMSSVTGVEVSDRGKALSVSAKGDEIRVWELEDLLSSWLPVGSTQLQPQYGYDDISTALAKRGTGLGLAMAGLKKELAWRRHWVGFDDEQVVVLGEREQRQILSCYDFA